MRFLTDAQLRTWLAGRGYVVTGYEIPGFDEPAADRYWLVPKGVRVAAMIDCLLDAVDPWSECVMHSAEWSSWLSRQLSHGVRDDLLGDIGLPHGYRGAIAFDADEVDRVAELLWIDAVSQRCGPAAPVRPQPAGDPHRPSRRRLGGVSRRATDAAGRRGDAAAAVSPPDLAAGLDLSLARLDGPDSMVVGTVADGLEHVMRPFGQARP
jgi:hypothetical protein